ncbi:hypothetical protein [Parapedobacter soli]|uniref:hypothetical protein n=1 Tax=Parapedobacter soli TaxID=416955 RepID=UPI0021C9931A|nr:hypothetical protein [Parapedobacter soli]
MNEDLAKSWEGKEPAPIEYLHCRLLNHFHEYRLSLTNDTTVTINGVEFNKLIAKAKTETYEKYEKLDLRRTINKSEL